MSFTDEQIEEEQNHFSNVIATFRQYAPYALNANNRRRKDIHILPLADRELLESIGYKERISAADKAILANADFLDLIVANPEIFGHDDAEETEELGGNDQSDAIHAQSRSSSSHSHNHPIGNSSYSHDHRHNHTHGGPSVTSHGGPTREKRFRSTEHDMDKLRSTLKQLVRDWSAEGIAERSMCYEPIKEALLQHFSDIPFEERHNFRVLIPGAGLGRLAWDVANLGFECQGNEFSHYMLLASFFMLNRTDAINKHTIYPYVHSFSNNPNPDAFLRPITIPDVLPSSLPHTSKFSLIAGDFEEIYGGDKKEDGGDAEPYSGQWDAVLTCFFIDTAKNIVNYLRIIHRILAPGGVWINMGPLLWHWENNSTNEPSVELTLDEVKTLARKIGFEMSNERRIDTTYTNNEQSMLGYVYHTAFWTATKIV